MPLPAVAAVGAAAAKAGAAAGKAGGVAAKGAAKGAAKAGKGAAKKVGKAAKKKARRTIRGALSRFFGNPIIQALLAIIVPLGIISYQMFPSFGKEIKIMKLIISIFAGAFEAIMAWTMIIVGLTAVVGAAAVGNEVAGTAGAKIAAGITALFTAPATAVGATAAIWHFFLMGLAWFILIMKFLMRSVLPKRI